MVYTCVSFSPPALTFHSEINVLQPWIEAKSYPTDSTVSNLKLAPCVRGGEFPKIYGAASWHDDAGKEPECVASCGTREREEWAGDVI